jgi:hypothetical protein
MDSVVVKRVSALTKLNLCRKRKLQHLCLDKAYNSKTAKQEIISRGYVQQMPCRRKRVEVKTETLKMSDKKTFCQKTGSGEPTYGITCLEAVHKIRKEGRELSWVGTFPMLYHYLQEDSFGISQSIY